MAVTVKQFRPSAFSITLLKTLEAGGIANPVLFGGAIRDQFLGIEKKIKDWDIWADFGELCDISSLSKEEIPDIVIDNVLNVLPGAQLKRTEGFDISETTGFTAIKLILDYEGQEVSLFLNNRPQSPKEKIQGDAPINAVVLTSDGEIFAHPDFEAHVNGTIYQPFPFVPDDAAQQRYAHLKEKIPHLSYEKKQIRQAPPEYNIK